MNEPETLAGALDAVFEEAGCTGSLYACDLAADVAIALRPDEVVISASVFKVLVALTFFMFADSGRLDPRERVRIDPSTSLGAPAGLSIFDDEVEVSLRDLVNSMLTVSDMIATDTILDRLGVEAVNETARQLGLPRTRIGTDVVTMFEQLAHDVGFESWAELAQHEWLDHEIEPALARMAQATVCDTSHPLATTTTARETTELLRLIWRDEAGPACAEVRRLMSKQLQRERIARAFKNDPDVRFAGKTGTFGGRFRNEAGVFAFPDGGRYAISVFTSGYALYERPRDIDDAIGEASRIAIEALRPG
jgi:beta-lactamase class A